MRVLVAARSSLRPRLGLLAVAFLRRRAYPALGFRTLGDYARERLGLGARIVREWARVWEALAPLPQLRTAVLEGEVSWSVARRVVAVASPDTDEACLESVQGRSVRAVEAMLRAVAAAEGEQDSSPPKHEPRCRVPFPLAVEDEPAWLAAVELARRMAGERIPVWECAEAIAAETLATLGAPQGEVGARDGALDTVDSVGREQAGAMRAPAARPAETARESGLRAAAFPLLRWRSAWVVIDPESWDALSAWAEKAGPHALDAALVGTVKELQRLDHDLGLLLREMLDRRLHLELGFSRFDRYVEERVDVSPRTARRWVRLARAGPRAQAVVNAFRAGTLSTLQAELLVEATTPETAPAWVERAKQVTLRRLEDDLSALTTGLSRRSFSAPLAVANVFLTALAAARAHVSKLAGKPASPSRVLAWMLAHAIASWREQGAEFEDYADFERDGFRCTAPDRLVFALGLRPDGPPLLRARSGDVLL